jgi:enamine deaminase RidA (YjgF/YER057c/UK114 family)
MRQHIDPEGLTRSPVYSQVVRAGDLVFVAGQCATRPSASEAEGGTRDPEIVGPGDPHAQARQCYENVRIALEAAGAAMDDVVKVTVFSTHPDYRRIFNDVRSEFFTPPYPASTGVVVVALFKPEAIFEIEAIAVISSEEERAGRR